MIQKTLRNTKTDINEGFQKHYCFLRQLWGNGSKPRFVYHEEWCQLPISSLAGLLTKLVTMV